MVWVKICGITNAKDAEAAVIFGADALGFVFAPSKRKIEPDEARRIISSLPDQIEKIGVFADEDAKTVCATASYCGLTGIQLHGGETPEYCSRLKGYNLTKAFRVKDRIESEILRAYLKNPDINRVLLDTYVPGQIGGTGQTFAWENAARPDIPPTQVIIAGGLTPGNVAQAIRICRPFGVDVSGGVEKEAGKKDLLKLQSFITRAKTAIVET